MAVAIERLHKREVESITPSARPAPASIYNGHSIIPLDQMRGIAPAVASCFRAVAKACGFCPSFTTYLRCSSGPLGTSIDSDMAGRYYLVASKCRCERFVGSDLQNKTLIGHRRPDQRSATWRSSSRHVKSGVIVGRVQPPRFGSASINPSFFPSSPTSHVFAIRYRIAPRILLFRLAGLGEYIVGQHGATVPGIIRVG